MCVWCSLDPRITTGSSCFFKYVATQLRMEKMPERAPVWTGPVSPPLSLSLRNSAGLAHVFRVEAYRFCWALQKAAAGLHWWVFKSRGHCTKTAGPRTQKFPSRVLSWSVQSSADESLVACPAGKGRDSQDWAGVIQDRWWHLEGGLSLQVVVRGSESGSGVKSPAGGTARSLSLPRLKHIWSPRLGTSNTPCVELPPRATLEIGRIQCRCPVFTRVETDEWSKSKFECGSAT